MGNTKVKGIVVELGGDATSLSKAIKSVSSEARDTQSELKKIERLLKMDPGNITLLKQKQELLNHSIEETEEVVTALKDAKDKADQDMANGTEINEKAYRELERQIEANEITLRNTRQEADKVASALNDIDDDSLDRVGSAAGRIEKALQDAFNTSAQEIKDLQKELKEVDKLLDLNPNSVDLLDQKFELLTDSVLQTQKRLDALRETLKKADTDDDFYIDDKAYRELVRQIAAAEQKLEQFTTEARKTANAINEIDDKEIHDVADAADDAEEALEDAAKEAADFGDVLKAGLIAEAAGSIVDSMKNVAEETKEYRKIMGSLEVSSEQAGYSYFEMSDAYRKLYGVLGDDQSAATTLANLQALGLSQENLLSLIDNCVGGWVKYGDSIPIDGLAEAINETAKAGQVTGTFADILNWGAREGETYGVKMREATEANEEWNKAVADAETAEDYFNLALQQCSSEAERANLIMQAMADQGLSEMSEKWKANNQALVDSNLAQESFTHLMASLGETVSPVMTEIQEGGALLLGTMLELAERVDFEHLAEVIAAVFDAVDQLIWLMVDNGDVLISILAGIASGLVALKIAEFVKTLSDVHSGVLTLTQAFPILGNAIAILTNPVFIVSAAIVGLVALIATKGDEIQAVLQKVDDFLQGVFATDWTTVFGPVLGGILNGFFANLKALWDSVLQILNGVIDFIRGVFTGDWERVWLGVKEIFGGVFSGLVALAKTPINFIIGMINSAIDAVNYLISGLNRIPGVNIGSIGQIPMLASGGTVWSGSAIVGEAGPELLTVDGGKAVVQPLSVNTNKIEGLLGDINGRLGSDEPPIPIKIQLTLDGNVIGETALKYSRMKGRAYGN